VKITLKLDIFIALEKLVKMQEDFAEQ